MSERARRMLFFYSHGLASGDSFDPNPQIHLLPTLPASSKYQEPQEEEEGPEVFEVSTSPEDTSRQEGQQQSDEDTETSSRAIELVGLEVPGTQPCNQRDLASGKRARSNSPDRTAYQAELWRKYLHHSTLDDRVQLQIDMDARADRREHDRGNRR